MRADPQRRVTVRAPGRLHLGFLDPSGSLGRRFGSLGLVIDGFETEVELGAAESDRVVAVDSAARGEVERVQASLQALRRHSACHQPLQVRLLRALPAHAGFGSGTQLALAVGRAFAHWHGLAQDTKTLAHRLGRGVRSGVGIAGFDCGGLLLDGGPTADGRPAPLLSRVALPAAWRVIVIQDTRHRGLSGPSERQAIATLPPLPRTSAADICHQVLMRVLPGAASDEFAPFAAGINRVQQLIGAHFAPAQGGAYTSAPVGRLLEWIGRAGPAAVGQSSWGPTGFAILPSQAAAEAALTAARAAGVADEALGVAIVSARNHGATITERRVPAPQPEPHLD